MRPGKVLLVGLLFGLSLVIAQESSESYELDDYEGEEDAEYDYIEEGEDEENEDETPVERELRKKLVKGKCMNTSPLSGKQLGIFKAYTKDYKKFSK